MKKILAKFKSIRVLTISLILLIVLFFVFLLSFSLGILATRDLDDRALMIKLLPVIRSVRSLSDIVYLPYQFKKSDLLVYQLEIDLDDLKFLNENLPPAYSDDIHLIDEYREYVPAKFIADNKEYSVEVRYRGDTSAHWSATKKSWLIKFKKGDLFEGIRRIHLILPFDRGYIIEHFNNYRAEKMGLITPKSNFAELYVNGRPNGVYFEIEGWDQELISKNQQPDETNVYGLADGDWIFNRMSDRFGQLGFWEKYTQDSVSSIDNFAEFELLLDLLNNASDEELFAEIPDLLDMDKFYKWQIHALLVNSTHQMVHDLRFYFNNATGKFELVPWDVEQEELELRIDENYNLLIERIFKNPKFVQERNKILWDYVKDDNNLEDDLRFFDQIYEEMRIAYYKDSIKVKSNLQFDLEIKERRQRYIDNYHYIQKALKDSRVFANVRIGENDKSLAVLDLETANFSAVIFQGLELETSEQSFQNSFQLYYDQNENEIFDARDKLISRINYDSDSEKFISSAFEIELNAEKEIKTGELTISIKPKQYRFFIISADNDLELIEAKFDIINSLSKEEINPVVRYVNSATFKYFSQINESFEKFHQRHLYFSLDSKNTNQINLLAGNYYINQTVIIPKGFVLKISPGAVLSFAPDASLISYSPVLAQGTKESQIKFMGQDKNKAWGVFAVLGPHERESIFEHCLVENGGEAYINGVFYSGQLAVHYVDTVVKNCRFQFANGDDGLNVKKGKVEIKNNYFYKNDFDGVDLDWVSGIVSNNQFLDNGNDGLDICGAKDLIIINNQVNKAGDKCLSIGEQSENTTVIFNNLLSDCQMGVAVKDASEVKLINNTIVNNKVGISVYAKKPVFGGAFPIAINNIIWHNEKSIDVDKKSNINISYSNIQGEYEGQGNLNQEPIFQNKDTGNYLLLDSEENMPLIKGGSLEAVNAILKEKLDTAPVGIIALP